MDLYSGRPPGCHDERKSKRRLAFSPLELRQVFCFEKLKRPSLPSRFFSPTLCLPQRPLLQSAQWAWTVIPPQKEHTFPGAGTVGAEVSKTHPNMSLPIGPAGANSCWSKSRILKKGCWNCLVFTTGARHWHQVDRSLGCC